MPKRSIIIAALLLFLFPALCLAQGSRKFTITSLVFRPGEFIPKLYTCEGANISPPLTVSFLPAKTKTLALKTPTLPQESGYTG